MSIRVDNWQPARRHRRVRDGVAHAFGVEPYVLIGRGRRTCVVWPRHTAMWVVRRCFPDLSYPMIAKLFGGRDHSTVIYGVQKVEHRRRRDASFAALTGAMVTELSKEEPSFVLDDEKREAVARLLERVRNAAPPKVRAAPSLPVLPARAVMPKNDFSEDDSDARLRRQGSDALGDAIAREGLVCR